MNRLLLLACSERKRADLGLMPAIERYDGPPYRVLRRYLCSKPQSAPDVYILSAQFGLIHGSEPIPMYDRRMTPQRAQELREATAARLQRLNLSERYHDVFLHAGATYRAALASPALNALPHERLATSVGNQGVRLSHLKCWLYREDSVHLVPACAELDNAMPMRFKLRGREYEITQDEVIAVARRSLKNGVPKGQQATAWYVLMDGQQIPPKWLVSQLTGLPVGAFHSAEARRILAQLGTTVRHI